MSQTNSSNNDASKQPASNEPSLRQRMSQDLQLRGMAKRTHDGYLREVRKLAAYYNTPPDQLTEQQVGEYLLYLINDCGFAPGSLGVAYSGIKFFYTVTEPRDWNVLRKLRRPKQKTLPAVLTRDEVHRLVAAIKQHRNAAYFEQRPETVGRSVFYLQSPASSLSHNRARLHEASRCEIGFKKKVAIHTLRHSVATHLFEAGATHLASGGRKSPDRTSQTITSHIHLRSTHRAIYRVSVG